jgi:hypothetical protein
LDGDNGEKEFSATVDIDGGCFFFLLFFFFSDLSLEVANSFHSSS